MKECRHRRIPLSGIAGALLLVLLVGTHAAIAHAEGASAVHVRLLNDLKYLASDDLEGRGVGTDGLDKAAEYIRDAFARAGLDVTTVEGDAFQRFTMSTGAELGEPNRLTLTGPDGKTIELEYDGDFRTCSFSGSGRFEGEVVFGGYAIDAKDEGYRDFAGIDMKGKVVIVMRRTPRQDDPHGPFAAAHGRASNHADLRTKVSNAFGQGAAAILFVNDPYTVRKNAEQDRKLLEKETERLVGAAKALRDADPEEGDAFAKARQQLDRAIKRWEAARKEVDTGENDELMGFGHGGNPRGKSLPIAHIKQKVANRMLQASLGKTLAELEAEIDADLKPRTTVLQGWRATGETTVRRQEADVKNVVGVLEGEGPRSDEIVIIGAHYDHLGMGGRGSLAPSVSAVHNGADDNASGTVALIEMARRLAARENRPPRTVVFIAFTAEERGLIGSAHYVKNPLFPLEKTVAMLNMDMVGRLKDDKLTVFGTGTAPRWKELIAQAGKKHNFEPILKPDGFGPSDHSSFYGKKIPVLHFFTGTHRDYHRPTDDWNKVNVEGMSRVVDLVEAIALDTIRREDRPQYVQVERKRTEARTGSRPYFGSIPDFGTEAEGYAISGVAGGSPAEKGGLKGGDVIVGLGGRKIGNLSDFDLALRKHKPGDEVEVVVRRDGKEHTFKVILAKPK